MHGIHDECQDIQVLQVPPRELGMRNDFNLPIALLANLHGVPKIPGTVVNLDLVMEEFLKGGNIENLIGGGLGSIDYELRIPWLARSPFSNAIIWTKSTRGKAIDALAYLFRDLSWLLPLAILVGIA